MQDRIHQTETSKRVLWIERNEHNIFQARYQPKNQKTGLPWQASRTIYAGQDVYVRHDYKGNFRIDPDVDLIAGLSTEQWTEGGKWKGGYSGYSTFALALAALKKNIK